jgi:hypothetical protein
MLKECRFSVNIMVRISGGNGASLEQAIIISDCNNSEGVQQEYDIVKNIFGDYKLICQALIEQEGKYFDKLGLNINEKQIELYFNITDFFGKW